MNRRFALIFASVGLAMSLLLTMFFLMTNAMPVQAAPAQDVPPAPQPAPQPALDAAPMQQTTVTPTYVISDSVTGGVIYDWIEIAGDGARVPLSGDNWGSGEVDIGFYFPFYDNVYRTFRVSTNGYAYFGQGAAYGAHTPIFIGSASHPNNFIAPFGADLYVHPDVSRVYVRRDPGRTVIEFVDIQWCCGLNTPHTFQIVLYPDGRILTQYRQVRYLTNPDRRVVAGIENADGSDGAAYFQGYFQADDSLDNDLAVLYDPGDTLFGHLILDTSDHYLWDDPGYPISTSATLFNLSGITDVFSLNYSLQVSSSVVPTASLWPVDVPETAAVTVTGPVTSPVVLPYPIANLGEATFDISATIPVTAGWWDLATLAITASARTSPTISTTLFITYGVAHRDLSIEKVLAPDQPPAPGGYFRYRLTVRNGGERPAQARNVRVTDTLPLSTTYDADYPRFDPPGDVGTLLMPGFSWDVGDMDANDVETLDVYIHTPSTVPTGTVLTNTCGVTTLDSIEYGPFDNNTAVHTTTLVSPEIDLDVTKLFIGPLGTNQVGAGHVATYTVGVANRGNVPVTGTIVTDVIPLGTTFYTTTWPTFTQMADGRTLLFTIGTVLNGDWNAHIFQVAVSVPLTTPLGTWLTNTVQVTTTAPLDQFAQAQGDEDDAVIQVIDPRGDAAVYKMPASLGGTPVTPEPGGDYTFWISYTNWGNVTVYTVTLTDTLPISHVVLLEAGPAGLAQPDTSTLGQVSWTIDELAPGAVGWTRVRIGIDGDTPLGTQLVNTAHIAAAEGLNITTTNDVSVVTVTLDATDVTIGKAVTPAGTLHVDDRITYTVRFTNTGVLTADGVRIVDDLPPGLTDVSWMTNTGGCAVELQEASPTRLRWRTKQAMASGDWGEIVITARLDPDATWPAQPLLTNQATIETTTRERPDDDPNEAQVSNPVALASPYVVKTGPTLALAGERMTYTIEYGNGGLLPAEGVRLTDTLPVSTTYVADTSGFTVTSDTTWVAWNVGALLSDTTGLTFTLVVSVSPDVTPGVGLRNVVALTSETYDGDRSDNESVWLTPVGFDLSSSHKLVNGQDSARVDPGTPVTYAIVLENAGSSDVTAVSLTDPIPDHTTYVFGTASATGGGAGYDSDGDAITWTGTVSGSAQVTVTFQVTVAQGLARDTVIVNTAYISDAVQTFEASALATVTGPDLSGSHKTVDEPQPNQGDRIIYTIVLSNSGEIDAVGASLVDGLPLDYVAYGGDGWASSGSLGGGDPITWTGTVTQGQRVTITLPVTVTAGPGNRFVNTARIDDGTAADEIVRSVAVQTARPDLNVQKMVSPGELASGERVTYTIAIANSGDGWAYSALLTDTIEGGTFAPGDAAASSGALDDSAPPTLTWTGEITPNGGSIYITLPVTITAMPGADVPNTVYVDDGYGNVVSDTTWLHVYSAPDLSGSTKAVDRDEARAGETLVYTLTVANSGELPTSFFVTDTLDADTVFTGFLGSPAGSGHAAGVITWTGQVAALNQAQLAFEAVISASVSGRVTNTARFGGDGQVYTRTASTDILVPAALTASKTVEPAGPVVAGGELTYTIVVQNVGGALGRAAFTDTIPNDTAYVGGSARVVPEPPVHAPPSYDGSAVTWEDDLAAGQTATIIFRVQVAPGTLTGTQITNVAELRELKEPGEPFSVSVTNTVVSPVFTASKRAEPAGTVLPGLRITYTVAITNVGGGVARVAVTDTLPVSTICVTDSLAVDPNTLAAPACADGILTWLDNVNAESVVRLTYVVVVSDATPLGTVLGNSALLRELSQPDDPVTVEVTHTVVAPALDAVKYVEPAGEILAGDRLTYTIVVSNSGSGTAQVDLSDPLPAHTGYVSASVAPSTHAPPTYDPVTPTVRWGGDVAPGEWVTLTLVVTTDLDAPNGAVLINDVYVQELSMPAEPFTRRVSNTILAPALRVNKTADPAGDVLSGAYLNYDVVIANDGGATATVYFSDTIPPETALVTGSVSIEPDVSPPTYTGGALTWQGTVGSGEAVTVSFRAQVDPGAISGTLVSNLAWIQEVGGAGRIYTDTATNTVVAPTLETDKQALPAGAVRPGETITYLISLRNPTDGIVRAVVTDTVPTYTHYVSASAGIQVGSVSRYTGLQEVTDLVFDPPVYDPINDRLTWAGDVLSRRVVTLTFCVTVSLDAPEGAIITNTAQIVELSNPAVILERRATNPVVTQFDIYLPLVLRNS